MLECEWFLSRPRELSLGRCDRGVPYAITVICVCGWNICVEHCGLSSRRYW